MTRPEERPLVVLARTRQWIAIDKPSGLAARPAPSQTVSALSQLEDWLAAHEPGPHPPGVVHRIDRGTSGVLLFSLEPEAHRALVRAFAERRIRKEYVAIVRGQPRPRRGLIDLPLRRNSSGRMVPDPHGLAARTRYETVRAWPDATQLRLLPVTGRMHQLRAHLAARGVPILGDPIYGRTPVGATVEPKRARLPRPPRLCLHAARLTLPPELAEGIGVIEAPLPEELRRYLRRLSASRSD